MEPSRIRLVAGLGNPGNRYRKTRHNVGFMAIDDLAGHFSIDLTQNKFDANLGRGVIRERPVILVKPQAFMNQSGPPIRKVADFFKIPVPDILVIHDDIDVVFGDAKIKEKGGDGGHRGVKSLRDTLGSDAFIRLRMGVGRPMAPMSATDHVLGRFNPEEQRVLGLIIERARDAVTTILYSGVKEAMNRFNSNLSRIIR